MSAKPLVAARHSTGPVCGEQGHAGVDPDGLAPSGVDSGPDGVGSHAANGWWVDSQDQRGRHDHEAVGRRRVTSPGWRPGRRRQHS
jgi:hypothetical protein